MKSLEEFEPEDDLQTILEKERAFEAQMSKVTRVQEDVLETVYLGEDQVSKRVKIRTLLGKGFKSQLVALLGEFKDVFAWEYSNMKGLDPQFYQHRIHLKPDAIPSRQQRYRMNPHMAKQVKEELDRLLRVGFIAPIENPDWISPIVIVPKKNKKLRICVDCRKLNAATIPNPFPLPYMDSMLDEVARHEIYSFLDGFSGYNQIRMAPEDQAKTAFITAWGVFVCTVMWFGLRNSPSTF